MGGKGHITIADLAFINPRSAKASLNDDDLVSFIPMSAVDERGRWVEPITKPYNEVKSGYTQFQENDVLFAKITPCAENGKGTHAVGLTNGFGCGSTEFHVLRPKPGVNARYLFQITQLETARLRAANMMTGSAGQKRVPTDFFEVFPLTEHDVEEQKRISNLLDSIDTAIEKSRDLTSQIESSRGALMQSLLFTNTKKSHQVRLGQLFDERKESGKPSVPILSVTMNQGLVRRDKLGRKVESELTPEQHLFVHKGDIAYNMMRMWQGVSGLAECDGVVSPAYVVLKPTKLIDSRYASYLFKLPEIIRLFHRFSQGLTNDRLRLYYDQFKDIKVTVPKSVKEQNTIAKLLSTYDRRIESLKAQSKQLAQVKTALSQKIFN